MSLYVYGRREIAAARIDRIVPCGARDPVVAGAARDGVVACAAIEAIGAGSAVAVAGISLTLHGVSDDNQPHSVRVHDGRLFLLAVVVGAAAATLLARLAQRIEQTPEGRRRGTAVLLAGIVLAAVAGIAVVATTA